MYRNIATSNRIGKNLIRSRTLNTDSHFRAFFATQSVHHFLVIDAFSGKIRVINGHNLISCQHTYAFTWSA